MSEPLWLRRHVNVYIKVNDLSTIPDLGDSGKFPTFGISEEAFATCTTIRTIDGIEFPQKS